MRTLATAVVMVLLSIVGAAQTPPPPLPPGFGQPPRDTSAQTGTAIVRGRVFDGATGQPLRKAQVRAQSPDLRDSRLATTDANGAYEFKDLAAGRYNLSASKGSYVGLSYGQTRSFEPGKPLEVRNAQLLDKIDFSLPRGAVITGRVVDEFGEPVADVQVAAMRYQYVQGQRRLVTGGRNSTTNDIGEFRLFALPPGQYVISATYRPAALILLPNEISSDRSGYAPTYYPGTANAAEAQRLTVAVGQRLSDLNIALSPTKLARISGTAVDSDGKPFANGLVLMTQRNNGLPSIGTSGQLRPDGTFSIANVAPGDYSLRIAGTASAGGAASTDFLQADLSVTGEDVSDVHIVGVKSPRVTGRIVAPSGQANTNFAAMQLLALPVEPQGITIGGPAKVHEDGSFEMNATPVKSTIRLANTTGSSTSARVKSVRLNGIDVTDTGVEFRPNEDVNGVEIELTNQLNSLSGTVTDTRGKAVTDYTVITFARDRERWGATSRFLNSGRPDQEGKYKLTYLPPGDYYAVAVDYVEQGAQTDPEFLERLKERATEFSISETETKSLDLKLVTGMSGI
jgi:protocatechuate 3,4-dioxygenase beta subunit